MSVTVAFFAAARDITGCDSVALEMNDEATLNNVMQELASRYPELLTLMEKSTWSLDHQYVASDQELHDGAEIGLIPPVSGG